MGKAFKHSDFLKRNPNDFYLTHHSIVWQLAENIEIPENWSILEPAAGNHDIVIALRESGIKNRIDAKSLEDGDDFLMEKGIYDMIITNPPFSLALEFILKSFEVAKKRALFLLPLDYLHGLERHNKIYSQSKDYYLANVYVLVRRPMFLEKVYDDGKYNTGSITFAWFDFQKRNNKNKSSDTKIKWINNQEYIKESSKSKKIDEELQGELF